MWPRYISVKDGQTDRLLTVALPVHSASCSIKLKLFILLCFVFSRLIHLCAFLMVVSDVPLLYTWSRLIAEGDFS